VTTQILRFILLTFLAPMVYQRVKAHREMRVGAPAS
jgi:hypothetical protein